MVYTLVPSSLPPELVKQNIYLLERKKCVGDNISNIIVSRLFPKTIKYILFHTDSTGQSALKSSELLENGLLSFEK